jgi:hypothetical protein
MDLEPLSPEPDPLNPDAAVVAAAASPHRRRRQLIAGAVAAVALVGGGWAAGAAIGAGASGATAASSPTGTSGSAATTACPAPPRPPVGIGKVGTVTGTTFTVVNQRGTTTVHTDGKTKLTEETTGAVSDAVTGTPVLAHGTTNPDGSFAATQLVLLPVPPSGHAPKTPTGAAPAPPRPARPAGSQGSAVGTVVTNSGGTLTITSLRGQPATIHTTGTTTVLKTVSATMNDVKPGLMVAAGGPAATDGSITASRVFIFAAGLPAAGPFPRFSPGMFGGFPGFGGRRGFGGPRGTAPGAGTGPKTTPPPPSSTTVPGKAPVNGGSGHHRFAGPCGPGGLRPAGPHNNFGNSGGAGGGKPASGTSGYGGFGQPGSSTF